MPRLPKQSTYRSQRVAFAIFVLRPELLAGAKPKAFLNPPAFQDSIAHVLGAVRMRTGVRLRLAIDLYLYLSRPEVGALYACACAKQADSHLVRSAICYQYPCMLTL